MVLLPGCVCCGAGCSVSDGIPRSDPKDEGNWTPSGTWKTGVTWTFSANPGDDSGETWYFYGSASTSGSSSVSVFQDWGNICNWWSSRNVSPSTGTAANLVKRATRLPPTSAVVHIYSTVSTSLVGPQTVKTMYVWNGAIPSGSEITTTTPAHDSSRGTVFNNSGAAPLVLIGTINGGAMFNSSGYMECRGTVNGGATFNGFSFLGLSGVVNGGLVLNDDATMDGNSAVVNGGAVLNDRSSAGGGSPMTINGGIVLNGSSTVTNVGFRITSVYGGAVFNDSSRNGADVYDGAVFNDSSTNLSGGTVYGGATFNDAACSDRYVGNRFATPCTKKFVAHPTDLPTCNGTALTGCDASNPPCGCN